MLVVGAVVQRAILRTRFYVFNQTAGNSWLRVIQCLCDQNRGIQFWTYDGQFGSTLTSISHSSMTIHTNEGCFHGTKLILKANC